MPSDDPLAYYRRIKKYFFSPATRLFCTFEVLGEENLPRDNNIILAANHPKWYAPILVQVYLNRPVAFVAKIELFRIPGLYRILVKSKQIAINRQSGSSPGIIKEFVAEVKLRIKNGMVVAIFPEGTRSPAEGLGELKRGVVMIAEQSGVDIVPVGLIYCRRGWRWPFSRMVVRIIFGAPLVVAHFRNTRDLMEELERQIATLSGLEPYRDKVAREAT